VDVREPLYGTLLSASANGTGSGFDNRGAADFGFLAWWVTGNSAVFTIQAAVDNLRYLPVLTVTAAANTTGTAALSAYYPWLRAIAGQMASAAGGSAQLSVYWQGGQP